MKASGGIIIPTVALASGARIGIYEIAAPIGEGGMGAVYRARQRSLDRQVALKILPSTLEADADFVSRFQREARIAASLNARPRPTLNLQTPAQALDKLLTNPAAA